MLAGFLASREIYDERLPVRPPYLINFPHTALFVEQYEGSGFSWVLVSPVVQIKLGQQERGLSPRGVEPYPRE